MIHALVQHHPGAARALPARPGQRGQHAAAVCQLHPRGKAGNHFLREGRVQQHRVNFFHMAPGRQNIVRKGAVIRQQHKAGAGFIQPARGEQVSPGEGLSHKVHHCGVARILCGAHHALGFVQHDIHKLFGAQRRFAARHGRALGHVRVRRAAHFAVQQNAPGAYGLARLAAAEAQCLGGKFIQPHGAAPPLLRFRCCGCSIP